MTKTLELVFRNATGKEIVLSILDPRADITLAQAQTVMQDIVTKNIFTSTGGDLVQIVEARINSREVTALA
jgi:hypothetical protein